MDDMFCRVLCLATCWNIFLSPVIFVNAACDENITIVQPAIAGDDVTLMFSPRTTILHGDVSWYRLEHTNRSKIYNSTRFVQNKENGTYYLIIKDSKTGVDDVFYYVEHLSGSKLICDSLYLRLKLVEPPPKPKLSPLKTIGNCTNCIAGKDKHMIRVSCEVKGGSKPFTVKMKIGGILHEHTEKDGQYYMDLNLTSTQHHMANVTCTVTNNATNITQTTKAYIYVMKLSYVPPSLLVPSRLIEGQPVNITCHVSYVRPPATNITMYIDGTALDGLEIKQELNDVTQLYTSWVTLTKFQRNWNQKNITCCEYNEEFKADDRKICSSSKTVDYTFPPSNVTIQMHKYIEKKTHYDIIQLECFINSSNPKCNAIFQAPQGIIIIQGHEKSMQSSEDGSITSIYSAMINVSVIDNGKMVKCIPSCEVHFEDILTSTWSILVESNATMDKLANHTDGRLLVEMIAGIGGVVALVAICVAVILVSKRRKPKVTEEETSDQSHGHDDEEMYNVVQKADAPRDNMEPAQMVYVDLEFDGNAISSSSWEKHCRESQVDYADIDIIKTAEIATQDNLEPDENTYINQ